ncbi:glycoside hydrolase family 25 protein [Streptomyces sp. NPDC054933]
MIQGVDVSSYQPSDFSTSGLSFAFTKATEGTGYINPVQAAQAATARNAGLVVGFYHYLNSSASMQAQAQYFVTNADSQAGDILACDWEETSVSGAEKDAFLSAVKGLRPTHRLVLYCNTYFWDSLDTTSDCADGLWIADITTAGQPRVRHPWTFHQYSDSGGIDRDVANFSSTAGLRSWAAAPTPAPSPTPKPAVDRRKLDEEVR